MHREKRPYLEGKPAKRQADITFEHHVIQRGCSVKIDWTPLTIVTTLTAVMTAMQPQQNLTVSL